MADVNLVGLNKTYGTGDNAVKALSDLTLSVPNGSFVVLLGPTGAGKTTTLRLLSGLDKPDSGEVHINGVNVTAHAPAERNVAMVFQQYSLYPHLSVGDNLAFPLKSPMLTMGADQIKQRVLEIATVLQIEHKLKNKATELSGGEMQRVSIGKALVRNPEIFLMDEPLSSLDAKLRAELRLELKRVQAELGATFLYVTHDQVEAMTMATHIGVLDNGVLVQFGSPREIYENPSSIYVASRLGQPRINTLPARYYDQAPEDAAYLGLRPEHLQLNFQTEQHPLQAEVKRIESLGDQTRVHLHMNEEQLVTLIDPELPVSVGQTVGIDIQTPLFFDNEGSRIN